MALQIADRLWLLDNKLGLKTGTPRELADSGVLEEYFLREGIEFDSGSLSFQIIGD